MSGEVIERMMYLSLSSKSLPSSLFQIPLLLSPYRYVFSNSFLIDIFSLVSIHNS